MNRFFHVANASLALMALAGGGSSLALMACGSSSGGTGGTGGVEGVGGASSSSSSSSSSGEGGGTNPYTGTNTCNDYITGNNWSPTLEMSDFSSEDAFNAWDALNTCACGTAMSAGGCEDLCSEPMNGTTTANFCNGVMPLSQCQFCLNGTGTATTITEHCGTEYTMCTMN